VGYTTGVFDLFHVGHLNILKQAKSQCERLVVGVSTDDLVATYKKNKPVIPFQERLAVVEAIRYVDEVVARVFCCIDVSA
jgi:glycerol-3-phosphate cytidylyltransferase